MYVITLIKIEINPEFMNCKRTIFDVIEIRNNVWLVGFQNFEDKTKTIYMIKFIIVIVPAKAKLNSF